MRLLILGISGMLGHTLFLELSRNPEMDVFGTVRRLGPLRGLFPVNRLNKIKQNVDAYDFSSIVRFVADLKPEIIVNFRTSKSPWPISGGNK